MSEPWKNGRDFVLYLNSGDRGTHALEPGVTTVRAAFRQELEIPLTLSDDWSVALLQVIYPYSYGNGVLKADDQFHCREDFLFESGPTREFRLCRYKHYDNVAHVMEELVEKLQLPLMPSLTGGDHPFGQLHMEMESSDDPNFPMNSKLDYFRRDILDRYLGSKLSLPTYFLQVKEYVNDATVTLMGADRVKYIWTLKASTARPDTHYTIETWAFGEYDLGESLALIMGFLEPDPNHPGQTRIVDHNTVTVDAGAGKRATWMVTRLDRYRVGIQPEDYPLGGVRLKLNIPTQQLLYMRPQKVDFDMGAWTKSSGILLPYLRQQSMWMVSLEPDRWAPQLSPYKATYFDHGLQSIVGTASSIGQLYRLPPLENAFPYPLSNVDLSRCYAEVDIVELSVTGAQQRHLLATVPLTSPRYGKTGVYHPQHVDFRPLAAPTHNLNQLRMHLRTSENRGIPFYTGLVVLCLYFRRRGSSLSLTPSHMSFQGGRRVTMESQAQRDVFPDNGPSHFRLRLPERWTLDPTWEVGLMQLLLPHTWYNVLYRQVYLRIHYSRSYSALTYLRPGAYVTLEDVVRGLFQEVEARVPQVDKTDFDKLKLTLDDKGFFHWTFPTSEFSIYIPAWLARVLGYLEWETWKVPFYYRSDQTHPTVEITQRDANNRPTEVELTRSHTMYKHSKSNVWGSISKTSFQNIYVHCNIVEPVYVGSQMAKVILTHGVNTDKQAVEDVFIPHLVFYRLSQFEFQDIEIDIRDNLGRPIPFQGGDVTATLYFRQKQLP